MSDYKHIKRTKVRADGRQRFIRIVFRVNEDEYEHFLKDVEKAQITKSEYLRNLINNVEIKEKPDREFYNTTQQLIRIGNNLNQIARKANSMDFINTKEYQENADELKNLIKEIKEKYKKIKI